MRHRILGFSANSGVSSHIERALATASGLSAGSPALVTGIRSFFRRRTIRIIMSDAPTIKVRKDGPYLLRGAFVLCDADGTPIDAPRRDGTIVLCRCGASANKPFCDGSHRTSGFTDAEAIPQATP